MIPAHLICTQCVCVVLHLIEVCVRLIWVLQSPHIHTTGPGFTSTSPAWSRIANFIPARSRGRPAEKTAVLGPPFGGQVFLLCFALEGAPQPRAGHQISHHEYSIGSSFTWYETILLPCYLSSHTSRYSIHNNS